RTKPTSCLNSGPTYRYSANSSYRSVNQLYFARPAYESPFKPGVKARARNPWTSVFLNSVNVASAPATRLYSSARDCRFDTTQPMFDRDRTFRLPRTPVYFLQGV